ncbi:MAG: ABC transporter permease [Candidatus Omnitrophica bacterium]|nr:ABC transporter permease [Candidatus Omnitrophota bacterium]
MRIELLISWRYLITRRKEKFISLISIISILGVAIGVMALIVVIAVMSGFDEDLRDKIVGNSSHITIASYQGITNAEYEKILSRIAPNPHIKGISPNVQGQVLVKEGEKFFAVGLRGIDPITEPSVTKIRQYVTLGNIDNLDKQGVIVGKELAMYLGLGLNSKLLIYSPLGKQYNLKVVGIFNSGMYDYDMNLVFTHLACAQEIMGMQNIISAIAIKLDDMYLADKLKSQLSELFGFNYTIKTWMEINQNFFAALKLEKLTMFIILTLIILVASLNIVSTLIVMVVQKTKDIGILRAIGINSSGIRRIFTYQGLIIGILGIFLGSLSGVAICMLLKKYQFIKLPSDIYYINKLPVSLQLWPDIIVIIFSALVITIVSTVYPANRAARLKPVEALRYE